MPMMPMQASPAVDVSDEHNYSTTTDSAQTACSDGISTNCANLVEAQPSVCTSKFYGSRERRKAVKILLSFCVRPACVQKLLHNNNYELIVTTEMIHV